MDDLKHLREVLTEAYPREELSLDALARVVAVLDGLPSAALDGGWTFKGFTASVQKLESEIEWLRAAAGQASFCLRTLAPDDADAQMMVRMLDASLGRA